jgi:hypothetical protein
MINNNMLYGIAALTVGTATAIPAYLALGSTDGTLTSGDTITSGEFSRLALTSKTSVNNVLTWDLVRTGASATSTPINTIGLWTSSTGGALWCNVLTSSLIQSTAFDVDFSVQVQFLGV